ncbi:MAG TPA: hypothetical protein VFE55_22635 [Acidimicrobiia bacterium]|nr:hypothetical protein [Acidimicrobiia bacterium]
MALLQHNRAGATGADDIPLYRNYNFPTGENAQTFQGPVPKAECGPGSQPESGQLDGEVTVADRESGRSAQGYRCNIEQVGHYGTKEGFEGAEWQLARYKDSTGKQCAYYSQREVNLGSSGKDTQVNPIVTKPGTIVLDVSDPAHPAFSENIDTPGMKDPWETLKVNQARGLLAATDVMDGEGAFFMGIYDIKSDCAHPKKLFDGPITAVNHEGNWAHDGMTYYTGGLTPGIVSAIDTSDPTNPHLLTTFFAKLGIHGMSTSLDGNRLFLSHINEDWPYTIYGGSSGSLGSGNDGSNKSLAHGTGIGIYDISEIQSRKPNPQVKLVSALQWDDGQIGQHTLNFHRDGKSYAIEVSEAGLGAARIIDVTDETKPTIVSKIKTQIMMPENLPLSHSEIFRGAIERGGDLQFGYNFHYCNIDKEESPSLLACSAFEQGLRLFDIRDVSHPKEIAYFNGGGDGTRQPGGWGAVYSAYAAAMPQFDPVNQEIWYTDHDHGFYVVKPTNGTWISDVTEQTVSHGN